MRDYSNIPVMDWNEDKAPERAQAQILHQEPVILQMPVDFDTSLNGEDFECRIEEDRKILLECDGSKVVQHLAAKNHLPGLDVIAEACFQSSSQVDIDTDKKRIIVHD